MVKARLKNQLVAEGPKYATVLPKTAMGSGRRSHPARERSNGSTLRTAATDASNTAETAAITVAVEPAAPQ